MLASSKFFTKTDDPTKKSWKNPLNFPWKLKSEYAKSRAWRACVLCVFVCLRAGMLGVFACLACLRAYVLACLRAGVLACLRSYVFGVFACLHACMCVFCLRASYDACLASLPLTCSRFCLIIYFVCINQGFAIKRKLLIYANLS